MNTNLRATLPGAMLALMVSMSAHGASYVSPQVGGAGGTAYSRGCGAGALVVGVQARWGMWLDQMTPVCQSIASNGNLGSVFTLARVGGTGGSKAGEVTCASGQVVAGVVVRWGMYVDYIFLKCASWSAASKTRGTSYTNSSYLGIDGTGTRTELLCPAGQVAKGFKGKAGSFVDSLSLVCNAWNQ